jgi:ubiquinone/menaquinone biosynthesis C-methylase UbiE
MSDYPVKNGLTWWTEGMDCCDPVWEAAYNRFETPEEERAKFRRRLRSMGIDHMPKNLRVADLFCGRGNNLTVLEEMGFTDVTGVDLSPNLLMEFKGRAKLYVGNCCDLKLPDASLDLVIVQGGMHHLPHLPEDLDKCFSEIARVLAKDGAVAFVEPWMTPFLRLAHFCSEIRLCQRIYPKLEALKVMTDHERTTYYAWLGKPKMIRGLAGKYFNPVVDRATLGKWYYLARKK